MSSCRITLILLRTAILLAILITLSLDIIIIHDLNKLSLFLPTQPTSHDPSSIASLQTSYFSMLLVPDLAAISLVCVLLWGRLRVQDDVHHTIFRILASICLVTLSIYRPIIFIAQLQTLIDYLQHAGKSNPTSSETPFTQLYSCQGPFNTPGDDQSQQNNTQFCWVFWVRIMFTFSWAFMVLAELMVAYADGEFCPEKKGFPTETELRTRRTGSGENVVEYNMLRTSEEGGQ